MDLVYGAFHIDRIYSFQKITMTIITQDEIVDSMSLFLLSSFHIRINIKSI